MYTMNQKTGFDVLSTVYKFDVQHIKIPAFYIRAKNDDIIPKEDVLMLFNYHLKLNPYSQYKEVSGSRNTGRDVEEHIDVINFFRNIKDFYDKRIDNFPVTQQFRYEETMEEDGEDREVGFGDLNIKI